MTNLGADVAVSLDRVLITSVQFGGTSPSVSVLILFFSNMVIIKSHHKNLLHFIFIFLTEIQDIANIRSGDKK